MARVTEMRYPNGWVEYYTYDKMGRLLAVDDTHPSEKPAKTQKHTYKYDANGNMIYEYMRGNGTGQAKNETLYTYDALNRLVTAHDNYGNSTRVYTYDSLGNLTLETGLGSHNCDYIYNNLNQQVDRSSDNWKSHTASTYDKRGNLVLEEYGKNKKLTTAGAYTFDETNKMVRGVNGNAEESIYTYNGLGALMEQTWIIAKNGYGYHDVSPVETPEDPTPEAPDPGEEPEQPDPGINNEGNGNNNGNNGNGHVNGNNGNHYGNDDADDAGAGSTTPDAADSAEPVEPDAAEPVETAANTVMTAALVAYGNAGNGNNGNNGNGNGNQDKPTGSDVKKTSTVVKQFVVDFSSETYKPLMEHEVNGLDYRYVYSDKARLSVVVQGIENGSASLLDDKGELHAYYHCDYLGTTDYLTSAVNSKVISWTSYSEWGEITHNAVLKCGARELDLVKEYATHDFDAVLNLYYAKARFYDADNRRFVAVDPILDPSQYDLREYVTDPMQLVQYLYVKDNAVNWIDPDGEFGLLAGTALATAASALIAGATSAYQSYKTNGKVNWSQAGKAAVGGALTAISVGVAVATGGTAAGLGVMAAGAIVGTRTALHGGTAADVASSMGKAAATALVGGKLLSTASTTTKFVVGTAGTIAGGIKTTKDVKTAVNTVKDKNATTQQKVATVYDAGVSAVATVGSAIYAAKNVPESIKRPVTSYLEKLQCVKTLGNKAATIGESLKFGSDVKSAQKLSSQMSRRGWTQDLVVKTVDNPFTTRVSINKATGNSATVYYTQRGAYVVVDDVTNEVVQVSDNKNPATWAPDREIIDPYTPD